MRFIVDLISVFVSSAFIVVSIAFIIMPGYARGPAMIILVGTLIEFARATCDFARHFRKKE